jgi:hypothetical protein
MESLPLTLLLQSFGVIVLVNVLGSLCRRINAAQQKVFHYKHDTSVNLCMECHKYVT